MVLHWLFKPMTTVSITTMAFLMVPQSPVRFWVLLALLLSLAGDLILMLGRRILPLGLLSFFVALLSYAVAFTLQIPPTSRQLLYLILPTALGLLVLHRLWPHLGNLRWAVAVYDTALIFLAWRAFSRFDALAVDLSAWLWGCTGAVLFMFGDGLLAWRRFAAKKIPYWLELGTYYLAQWCLVSSFR